jgi:hypothetical protein
VPSLLVLPDHRTELLADLVGPRVFDAPNEAGEFVPYFGQKSYVDLGELSMKAFVDSLPRRHDDRIHGSYTLGLARDEANNRVFHPGTRLATLSSETLEAAEEVCDRLGKLTLTVPNDLLLISALIKVEDERVNQRGNNVAPHVDGRGDAEYIALSSFYPNNSLFLPADFEAEGKLSDIFGNTGKVTPEYLKLMHDADWGTTEGHMLGFSFGGSIHKKLDIYSGLRGQVRLDFMRPVAKANPHYALAA